MIREEHIGFLLRLFFFTAVAFGAQLLVLNYFEKALFDAMLIEAYAANLVLAIFIYFLLYTMRRRFTSQLGFLFLLGSLLKFTAFFALFNGPYKQDGSISAQELFAFFVPYTVTLIVEVFSLSKWMNKLSA